MEYAEIVARLSAASGPSGFEGGVCGLIKEMLEPYVDSFRKDAMGNLIAVKRCGEENARSLLLDAHMDEIGLIVTGYENGYLRFGALGGVDPRMLPAREVRVLAKEPLYGVVDVMPPHALSAEDMDKSLPMDKLYIDIGMTEEEAEKAVPLGTPIVYAGGAERLGEEMLCGKALDDRSCVAVIIKVMEAISREKLPLDIVCLISTQEEMGLRGAVVGAYGTAPDYAIAIDVTHGETPDAPKHQTMKMGGGPAVGVGPNFARSITDALLKTAEDEKIPCQIEVTPGRSGTDAWSIQTAREGTATALVSLPLRYMHSPIETMLLSDGENIAALITKFICRAGEVL